MPTAGTRTAARVRCRAAGPRRGPVTRLASARLASARLASTLLALAFLALVAGGCRPGPAASSGPTPDPDALEVVATTTVLADLVAQVGGPRVDVHSLVPKGGEVHTFDPTPADIDRIAHADLIVRNGLGLDDWLAALVEDAGTNAPVVALGEHLPGVQYLTGDAGPGSVNPHVWMDVANAERYVDRIRDELSGIDPAHASAFAARATTYTATLAALDQDIRDRMAAIPEDRRTVVSFHDAFPYFAAAYGLTILGNVVDAPGQDPSAGEIGDLIRAMQADGVRVIFAEAQFNDALVEAIAADTGAVVVDDLYDDTLGDPPADTYLGMMRWNADRVVSALTSQ